MAFNQFPQKGGIPSGNTAGRPSGPVIGDTYYNGQLEILEIFNGTSFVAVSAPPATPTITSVTDVGTGLGYATGGTFTVVLAAGSGGGTPSQYNVYTTSGGFSASSSSTTVSLTGLTPGTSFTVYGNAQNNFGTTVNTANAAAVTATTVPQAPTIGTLSDPITDGNLSLTFTAGATGGKSISNYQYSIDNGSTYTAFSPAQTTSPLTISGLTNGTSYTVRLKAVNANGVSTQSSASNSATPTAPASITFLVIAGGGGGGKDNFSGGRAGGGGGAGGYRSSVSGESSGGSSSPESNITAASGVPLTITVGAGGAGSSAGGDSSNVRGNSGSNSVFSSITSDGGGGGGGHGTGTNYTGLSGGSGGGGSNGVAGGSPSTNQGYAGGAGSDSANYNGGGGGGAGQVGQKAPNGGTGGNGGNGIASSITGTSITRAGGGGGGAESNGGTGGSGGGGRGSNGGGSAPISGTANLGGGGGGARYSQNGASGGSGIVILKYPSSYSATFSGGVTQSTSTVGGYKISTVTAAGISDTVTFS